MLTGELMEVDVPVAVIRMFSERRKVVRIPATACSTFSLPSSPSIA